MSRRGRGGKQPRGTAGEGSDPPANDVPRLDGPPATALGGVAAFVLVLLLQRSFAGRVADPDTLYHLGHAEAYLQGSIFDTAFPWATRSVIGAWGADLWWGFHVLLLPFAGLWDLPGSIPTAGAMLTSCLLAGVLWMAVRHGWVWPWMWPLFFLCAVPNVMYRHLMVRPHVLSLLAALVLLSALSRERWKTAAAAAFLLVWVHASIFWMPLLILVAHLVSARIEARLGGGQPAPATSGGRSGKGPVWAILAGTAAGLLLRPHPLATLRLVYVQIFQLLGEQSQSLPLSFGGELVPLPAAALVPSAWLLFVPWTISLFVLIAFAARGSPRLLRIPRSDRLLLAASALLSLLFLMLSLTVAGRAMVEWAAFATVLVAGAAARVPHRRRARAWAVGLITLLTVLALPWIGRWHALNVRLNSLPSEHLRQAAEWIRKRSAEDDVVFHAHWDNFAPLFAWNRRNHYLGGMDPIFQFAYDPELYWKHANLAAGGMAARTCGLTICTPASSEDTYEVLVRDFDARWVLVEPRRNPGFFEYLMADPRFDLSLRTAGEAVFAVLRPAGPSAPGGV